MIAVLVLAAVPSIVPWPRSVQRSAHVYRRPPHPHVAMRILSHRDTQLGEEGYTLTVDSRGINAEANTHAGLFYAMQTFEQLGSSGSITIRDWPAYRWRGVHLDVARHFFDVRTIERYIDVAAHYKLNVFHWHLTDDQAWRLPIPGYARLTAAGRFYSDAQVREIVSYAQRRYVTVLPEIEMPSHASAAIAAYPQLGCGESGTLCDRIATHAFLRTVLGQVFKLFPASYVDVGGDEVPAGYNRSALIASLERYARAHGRRIVGWDEILHSRLSPRTIVMAWNSIDRAAEAAKRGNDAVVSGWPLYFDAAQGDPQQEPRASPHVATLAEVYAWDVMPAKLSGEQKRRVLGGEAALWTERIASPQHVFYMLLPRELALAEMLWTPRSRKNWPGFLARLPAQFAWLSARSYPFRIPNALITLSGNRTVFTAVPGQLQSADAWTTAARLQLTFTAPISGVVRYTLDGSDPRRSSPAYAKPIVLNLSPGARLDIRAATWFASRFGSISECRIHRVSAGAMPRVGVARSFSALVSP